LQLEADIWALIESHPKTYALLLAGLDGKPVAIGGGQLRAMLDAKTITLYPATYRLVYDQGSHVPQETH
jgi:hypothetical protein